MRIALVGAEFEENLAIRCIWGALAAAGHEVHLVVFNDERELERAARELADSDTAVAGFSMVFTHRAREFARLATRARELGYRGHVVAGGHFAAFNAESLLRDVPAFDSVACGEGEEILCDLAAHLGDLSAVRGLAWRKPTGDIVRNRPAAKPADLDSRPYPVRKEPFDSYLGLPIVNLLASRGCTHACAFCSIAAWHRLCGGERFRVRRADCVADEMARLYRRGVRIFNFHDDNFLPAEREAALERVAALRRELRARRVGRVAFAIKARPDEADGELFAALKALGLFRVFLGIEAGTAESLRRLGRGQSRDDNERALDVVNRLDLHACFNLLAFNPDSTLEDFAANVAFLRQHPRNPMNFCRTEIYAGTPLEAKLRREGRLRGSYWGYDYQIADPRAQQAFEIVYRAFRDRNYGARGLHHVAMGVDYEHQLLAHFWGTAPDLRRRVKDYVVAVNLNTCGHLEAIVAEVARGLSPSQEAELAEAMAARVGADNAALVAAGDALLADIRSRAVPTMARRRWMRSAAGLAASLALAGSACSAERTAPCEMAADRPGFDPEQLRPQVLKEVLPRLAPLLRGPASLRLSLALDEKGAIRTCTAERASDRRPALKVGAQEPALGDVVFRLPRGAGRLGSLVIPARDVLAAIEGNRPARGLHDQVLAFVAPRIVGWNLEKPVALEAQLEVLDTGEVRVCTVSAPGVKTSIAEIRTQSFAVRGVPAGRHVARLSRVEIQAAMQRAGLPLGALPPRAEMAKVVLPRLAEALSRPYGVEIYLLVGENGRVGSCDFHTLDPKALVDSFRDTDLILRGLQEGRYTETFSPEEVRAAMDDAARLHVEPELDTHMREMVPAPLQRLPDTHMCEEAPVPLIRSPK